MLDSSSAPETQRGQSVLWPIVRSWRILWVVFNVLLIVVILGYAAWTDQVRLTDLEFQRFAGWGLLLANGTFLIGPALDSLVSGTRLGGAWVRTILFLIVTLVSACLTDFRLIMFELSQTVSNQ